MIASLLVAGFLQDNTHLETADWGRILSYALSAITLGEICGFYFSVKYPDSVDPKSQFDGATTVGALIIPVLQIGLLLIFIPLSGRARQLDLRVYWGLLSTAPLLLLIFRYLVLKIWVCRTMLQDREAVLKTLSG
jgi:hypothetical protein